MLLLGSWCSRRPAVRRRSLLDGSAESRIAADVGTKVLGTWRPVQLDFGRVMGAKEQHSHVPSELICN